MVKITTLRLKYLFFILFTLLLIFLFFPKDSLRADECECACACTCYSADTLGCNPTVFQGTCLEGCPWCPCNCPSTPCSGAKICEKCGGWQVASRCKVPRCEPASEKTNKGPKPQPCCEATIWSPQKPKCLACSECIDQPENPKYYDNPLCPLNPFQPEDEVCKKKDPKNIFLPVKLDWDDVEGWIEGGWRKPKSECVKRCDGERCIYSYPGGCEDWVDCRKNCKEKCLKKAESFNWDIGEPGTARERAEKEVAKEIEFRNFVPKCDRECEITKCDQKIEPNSGCGALCPFPERCHPDSEYLKSYIIEIKGEDGATMRAPQALKKIEILERENELLKTMFPEEEGPIKIIKNEEEVEKIKNEELAVSFYGAALEKSEFIPPTGGFFKSNRTYQWRVRACIRKYGSYKEYKTANGLTCGAWSDWWEFKTNPSPEPRLPYDVDWAGKKESKNIPKWEIRSLRWAEIDDKEFEDEKKEEGKRCRQWYYNINPEKTKKEKGSYSETLLSQSKKTEVESKEYCRENYCLTILSRKEKEGSSPQLYCRPLSHNVMLGYRYKPSEKYKCHPQLETKTTEGKKCKPTIVRPFPSGWPREKPYFPFPKFQNKKYDFFTKLTSYSWQSDTCVESSGEKCSDWSQKWQFSVADFLLKKPKLVSPPNDVKTPVGLPVTVAWSEIEGAMSYRYEVSGICSGKDCKVHSSDLTLDYPQLKLDTVYHWRVNPCWDYNAEKCQNNWSERFSFLTTGRPPKLEPLASPIPVTFKWEAVPGAKSYRFTLHPSSGPTVGTTIIEPIEARLAKQPTFTLDYPALLLNSEYTWRIETCARSGGGLCGKMSDPQVLKTLPLPSPIGLQPPDRSQFVVGEKNYYLSWASVPNAKFYKYRVEYVEKAPEETNNENCQLGIITYGGTFGRQTDKPESDFIPLKCLGKYKWQVRACLGGLCETEGEGSPWSAPITFSLVSAPSPPGGAKSLVPCGRRSDNPNTPWNEAEPCQIKHFFILLYNILDFFLTRLIPIILVILVAATGVIFYLSFGAEDTLVRIKSLWRAAGIGFLLIFFGWFLVDIILKILGYNTGIFGPWWQIKF